MSEVLLPDKVDLTRINSTKSERFPVTIGYEIEVTNATPSRIVPALGASYSDWSDLTPNFIKLKVSEALAGLDFKISQDIYNGVMYEIISPAMTHPCPLALSALAIEKSGLLPKTDQTQTYPLHISLGYHKSVHAQSRKIEDPEILTILRIAELLGATTADRLSQGAGIFANNVTWSARAPSGLVKKDNVNDITSPNWQGKNNVRLEFRTPQYINYQQLFQTLEVIYYLGRGFAESDTVANQEFNQLLNWFDDFIEHNQLHRWMGYTPFDSILEDYINSYANFIKENRDTTNLRARVATHIKNIREEFGLQNSPSVIAGQN